MAPTPSPPGVRDRRNLDQPQFRKVKRNAVPVPAMPGETSLTKVRRQIALEYWNALWSDLGAIYTAADRHPIARLCVLHSQAMVGKLGAQAQGELRQLEAAFGGSPAARRKLWIVVEDDHAGETASPGEPIDMAKHRERRQRLAGGDAPSA